MPKKTFSLTLNVMISQLVRLFELKFGLHVHQQVRFKILRLHTSKNSHIYVIHLVLERCCFEAVLPKRRLGPLGVNGMLIHFRQTFNIACGSKQHELLFLFQDLVTKLSFVHLFLYTCLCTEAKNLSFIVVSFSCEYTK